MDVDYFQDLSATVYTGKYLALLAFGFVPKYYIRGGLLTAFR